MIDDPDLTQDERTKYSRYKSKRNARHKPVMPIEEWAAKFRAKIAAGWVWPGKEQPADVPDGVWDKYVQFRCYRRSVGKSIPDIETYQRDHRGKVGRNGFGFNLKKREASPKPKRPKTVPNPICKADLAAIVEKNQRIVEEKLGIKLRRVA